jgi:hypothetical protein
MGNIKRNLTSVYEKVPGDPGGSRWPSTFSTESTFHQVDLGGHPPFPLNQHFKPMVLINHDIHPFDGEWNVMPSSFVNYKHHVMIS